ncbi:hypothetical protein [Kordiimonas aestuarii]|uniref:hypothetical protein n=1 Tax=Kordiimonas aestuarii TaxID=1005925 RepID=UPI0021D213D6|nr:hypothetical protein [Kordiimonas aestuarii]
MLKPVTLFGAGVALFALVACGEAKNGGEEPEGEMDTTQGAACDPSTMMGTVHLNISGNAGDSFRISYMCGGQMVTQCTATVAAGSNNATCTSQGNVPQGGTRRCPVGPGNGNTPQARVVAAGCG